jgi:hypothetical protein
MVTVIPGQGGNVLLMYTLWFALANRLTKPSNATKKNFFIRLNFGLVSHKGTPTSTPAKSDITDAKGDFNQ